MRMYPTMSHKDGRNVSKRKRNWLATIKRYEGMSLSKTSKSRFTFFYPNIELFNWNPKSVETTPFTTTTSTLFTTMMVSFYELFSWCQKGEKIKIGVIKVLFCFSKLFLHFTVLLWMLNQVWSKALKNPNPSVWWKVEVTWSCCCVLE